VDGNAANGQMPEFSEDRLVKALWDVLNPFRLGGVMARVSKVFGAGAIMGSMGAIIALPTVWSKSVAVGIVVVMLAAGVSASYQHRKRLEMLDSEEARERREIERCARIVLMDYTRAKAQEGLPLIADPYRHDLLSGLEKSVHAYRGAISSANYYQGASAHGEACALAEAALDTSDVLTLGLVTGMLNPMLDRAMEMLRELGTTPPADRPSTKASAPRPPSSPGSSG